MYEIPIISTDLRHEEAIVQTALTLQLLQDTMDSIFSKINSRAERNLNKINSIQERINNANEKVVKLIGSKKSIKIFSPAKFPSSEIFEDIPITFATETDQKSAGVTPLEIRLLPIEISSHTENPGNFTQEKLHLYHVKSAKEVSTLLREGLGSEIPSSIKSVNSLLLFAGNQNIYEKYKSMETLASRKNPKANNGGTVESPNQKLEAAPNSITNRQYSCDKSQRQYTGIFYSPGVAEAPKLELPLDLPDLPGVAGDVQFGFMENLSVMNQADDEINFPPVSIVQTPTSVPEVSLIPPPPPPPVATSTYSLIPPPPPPPTPAVLSEQQISQKSTVERPAPPKTDIPDARSNLMAAIRNAGGRPKLRAAADLERKETPKKPKENKGMDLMTDLHNKLMMRRKGISGAQKEEPQSVKDRLSSMIPAPTKKYSDDEKSDGEWTE